ncbi:UNVERIFIED_CONTAM: UDP-glycosyltransferase 76E1 [Sesamum calycinum]|uniref:UDP-glycosyltransferase 76E1 n=1 Tax=Sesamum calycinum TaxID=2727403 RepID=A0AAW2SDG0_9LAMI
MMKMVADEEVCGRQVACIIYDSIMNFVDAVAGRLKLPSIVLRTTTAAYMHSHNVMFQLLAENLIPLPECQLEAAIPQVYPLRFKDLPLPATIEIPQIVLDFMHSYMDIRSSSAVIWNTIDQLDHWPLQQLEQHWPVPFFSIGPFHRMAPAVATSLLEEENSCLSWLDKQAPNSVIYASLGSVAIIDENELIEMAWGLAKSEQPFLWAVRPSLLNGPDAMNPYRKNSSNHSRKRNGGQMGASERPCFADQLVNARYLTYVWRVGIELQNARERTIEEAIRTLMVSKEGEVIRQRAFHMKREIERSINDGGSSHESLNRLVEFIISLPGTK